MPIRILFSHRKARICDKFGSAAQYIILLIQVIQKFTCYIEQTYLLCKFSIYTYLTLLSTQRVKITTSNNNQRL